jgi:hypothetical protein
MNVDLEKFHQGKKSDVVDIHDQTETVAQNATPTITYSRTDEKMKNKYTYQTKAEIVSLS